MYRITADQKALAIKRDAAKANEIGLSLFTAMFFDENGHQIPEDYSSFRHADVQPTRMVKVEVYDTELGWMTEMVPEHEVEHLPIVEVEEVADDNSAVQENSEVPETFEAYKTPVYFQVSPREYRAAVADGALPTEEIEGRYGKSQQVTREDCAKIWRYK